MTGRRVRGVLFVDRIRWSGIFLTSNIEHRTSNIEHRTSNIEHRTSNIEWWCRITTFAAGKETHPQDRKDENGVFLYSMLDVGRSSRGKSPFSSFGLGVTQ
jgi:hypothetical protein